LDAPDEATRKVSAPNATPRRSQGFKRSGTWQALTATRRAAFSQPSVVYADQRFLGFEDPAYTTDALYDFHPRPEEGSDIVWSNRSSPSQALVV
jgi:hypothetical protein